MKNTTELMLAAKKRRASVVQVLLESERVITTKKINITTVHSASELKKLHCASM